MSSDDISKRVSDLVTAWFQAEFTMFDAATEDPEAAWLAIVEIARHDLNEEEVALLASGPLETLLVWHGLTFVDRVLEEAKSSNSFRHLLGAVWRRDMPKDVWDRIEKVRGGSW